MYGYIYMEDSACGTPWVTEVEGRVTHVPPSGNVRLDAVAYH